VTICNVHVVVSASRDAAYRDIINGSDMATPDGRAGGVDAAAAGFVNQPRHQRADLMWALCERAAKENLPVYCYGSTPATLACWKSAARGVPACSDDGIAAVPCADGGGRCGGGDRINASGAGIVFVGLGCPSRNAG